MEYLIEVVDDSNKFEMLEFLKQHENYTLFLLGNFESYGFKLSEAPYSGNFKLIRSYGKIIAVFSLSKKGSLLIEATVREPIFDLVLAACQKELIALTGLIGNWDFCNVFWQYLKDKKVIQKETFTSKEILYSVDISNIPASLQSNARLLTVLDYDQWKPLRLDFLKEEGIPNNLSEDQLLDIYRDKVRKKITWGFFLNDKLVSIADLNAKALDLGQVGGVYTAPRFRQRGYSKAVMQQLLYDAKNLHSIRKLIIFTGENNFPAQKLYTGLGAKQEGYFTLFFGNQSNEEQCEEMLVALSDIGRLKNLANISITLDPLSNEIKKQIYEGFNRHAIAMTGHDEKSDSIAFIANDDKSFAGAVVVELFWGALHIKYVYVEEEYRNRGIATLIMEQALAYGRDNQCSFAFVETMNFQALGFYQKMGFKLEFTRTGYKHGTSFHYLRKDL